MPPPCHQPLVLQLSANHSNDLTTIATAPTSWQWTLAARWRGASSAGRREPAPRRRATTGPPCLAGEIPAGSSSSSSSSSSSRLQARNRPSPRRASTGTLLSAGYSACTSSPVGAARAPSSAAPFASSTGYRGSRRHCGPSIRLTTAARCWEVSCGGGCWWRRQDNRECVRGEFFLDFIA